MNERDMLVVSDQKGPECSLAKLSQSISLWDSLANQTHEWWTLCHPDMLICLALPFSVSRQLSTSTEAN